jgi:hypothetical protein
MGGKWYVSLNRPALVREQGEGGERDINLCMADERENPRGVREHLDRPTFGLVTGGVPYDLERVARD